MKQFKTKLPILVWALICIAIAVWAVNRISSSLSKIEWWEVGFWLLMLLLAAATIALVYWLFKSPTARGRAVGVVGSGRFWRVVRNIALVWIVLFVLTKIYYGVPEWYAARQGSVVAPANAGASAGLLPADVVLPIIAQCESGGRQFDDEGNLITNPKSTAVGKYQIMASLHEERAKKMGFDIRTAQGNEQYAQVLYAESGTKHWESDLKSRKCWEPELVALGYRGSNTFPTTKVGTWTLNLTPETPAVVSVPPGHKWELVGKIPTNGWTTDNGYRDARGNRIQIFEVVAPAKETTLKVKITKCANCPW